MSLTSAQIAEALSDISIGRNAQHVISAAARLLHNRILQFQSAHAAEFARIIDHQGEMGNRFAEEWPAFPLFAADRFNSAEVEGDHVCITTYERYPGDQFFDHSFTVCSSWLSATDAWIEAELQTQLANQIAAVDTAERERFAKEEAEAREQFDALKERFEP